MVNTNDNKEVPRPLTEKEIEDILSDVPPPQIAIREIRDHAHEQIKTMFRYTLGTVQLKPSRIGFFKDEMVNKISRSYYQPGNPIGFNVGESVGQPATQLVLDTFHSAGQNQEDGFDRFERNIGLKKNYKNDPNYSTTIHMKDYDVSYEDLYVRSHRFRRICLIDLIETPLVPETYPFEDRSNYVEGYDDVIEYTDDGMGFRLRFNRELLYLHAISLSNIANALLDNSDGAFTVYYGPTATAVVDVYPRKNHDHFRKGDDFIVDVNIYEKGVFNAVIRNIWFGDFMSISKTRVVAHKTLDLVLNETVDPVDTSLTRVWVDWIRSKRKGVPVEKLHALLKLTEGIDVVDIDPDNRYYLVNNSHDSKIKEVLSKLYSEEEKRMIESYRESGRCTSSPYYLASTYNTVVTTGTELAKIRLESDVDDFVTISDSAMEIYDVYGIEVARAFIEQEIYYLFSDNNQMVAPRNIGIMVDAMTNNFYPVSLNPAKIPKADKSAIRSICYQMQRDNTVKASVLSTKELVGNSSSRVIFGLKQTLGTGAFKIEVDPEVAEIYENFDRTSVGRTPADRTPADRTPAGRTLGEVPGAYRLTKNNLSGIRLESPDEKLFDDEVSSLGNRFDFDYKN